MESANNALSVAFIHVVLGNSGTGRFASDFLWRVAGSGACALGRLGFQTAPHCLQFHFFGLLAGQLFCGCSWAFLIGRFAYGAFVKARICLCSFVAF